MRKNGGFSPTKPQEKKDPTLLRKLKLNHPSHRSIFVLSIKLSYSQGTLAYRRGDQLPKWSISDKRLEKKKAVSSVGLCDQRFQGCGERDIGAWSQGGGQSERDY